MLKLIALPGFESTIAKLDAANLAPVANESDTRKGGERKGGVVTAPKSFINGESKPTAGHFLGDKPQDDKIEPLDAAGFLAALKVAGRIKGITDPVKEKEDKILALRRYVGFSPGQPLGTQIDSARRKALTAIKGTAGGPMTQAEKRSAYASQAGYVKGAHDALATERANLEARIARADWWVVFLKNQSDFVKAGTPASEETLAKLAENPEAKESISAPSVWQQWHNAAVAEQNTADKLRAALADLPE